MSGEWVEGACRTCGEGPVIVVHVDPRLSAADRDHLATLVMDTVHRRSRADWLDTDVSARGCNP